MAIGQERDRAVDVLRLIQMIQKRYPACILAACCIPWNPDGTLADEILRREIRNLLRT